MQLDTAEYDCFFTIHYKTVIEVISILARIFKQLPSINL